MMSLEDLYWTAGFFEGEGSFCNRGSGNTIIARVTQVQRWPLEKLQQLLGGSIHARPARKDGRGQANYEYALAGFQGAGLAMSLYPLLSPGRQRQIGQALAQWKKSPAMARHFINARIRGYGTPVRRDKNANF